MDLPDSPFVGTWLLVSQHSLHPGGRKVLSRGENPAGILMYDRDGNMAVQLVRTDDRARDYADLASFDTAMQGFHAYFGRYEVDEEQQVVRHHVTGSGYFDYRGTTQIRRYTFDGDTLTLEAKSSFDDTTRVLVWRRAGRF
jgi:hypothetical protein